MTSAFACASARWSAKPRFYLSDLRKKFSSTSGCSRRVEIGLAPSAATCILNRWCSLRADDASPWQQSWPSLPSRDAVASATTSTRLRQSTADLPTLTPLGPDSAQAFLDSAPIRLDASTRSPMRKWPRAGSSDAVNADGSGTTDHHSTLDRQRPGARDARNSIRPVSSSCQTRSTTTTDYQHAAVSRCRPSWILATEVRLLQSRPVLPRRRHCDQCNRSTSGQRKTLPCV